MSSWRRAKWGRALVPLLLTWAWALAGVMAPPAALAVPQGGYTHPEVLIQPEELKALIDAKGGNVRIIDFRHNAKYYLGHIPGAIQVWRPETEDRSHPLPGMPASPHQMEKLLGHLGISSQNDLVIYSDQFDHTRLWWILASYGFPLARMKLLDGGIEAWKSKNYPTQLTSPRFKATTFRFPAEDRIPSLSVGLSEVKEALTDPRRVILDVRSQEQFRGVETKEGAPRPGHIPGAVWVYWKEATVPEGPYKGYFKRAEEIGQLYSARGVTPDKDVLIYGYTDLGAAHTLVGLYLAGYPLEKLHIFAGSWIEWSRSKEPVATGP